MTSGPTSPDPSANPKWAELAAAAAAVPTIRDLLDADPGRPARSTVSAAGITLDFARQQITPQALAALIELAEKQGVFDRRTAMFAGSTSIPPRIVRCSTPPCGYRGGQAHR